MHAYLIKTEVDLSLDFVVSNYLIKTEVDLSLDFVVQKLLLENGQGVVGAVVVQVQRVEDAPEIILKLNFVSFIFLQLYFKSRN